MYTFSRFSAYHTHTHLSQGNGTEEKFFGKSKVFKEGNNNERGDKGRTMDRNREMVPDGWSLVRERALTTGLCAEGWYSEPPGVCRRAELQGQSVKVKMVCFHI